MAHKITQPAYQRLTDRLNRFPQGAPSSALLTKILELLFDPKEAQLVSLLPIRPFTAEKASTIWKIPEKETRRILDQFAGKALLVDFEVAGVMQYVLPPPTGESAPATAGTR